MYNSLQPHGLPHARLPCPSQSLRVYLDSCPLSWWFHPVVPPKQGSLSSVQFSSVAQSCLTICNPTDCSTPGFPVCHQLPEFTQTHVHWVSDAIQPSHPLLSPSPPTFNLSQHQCHSLARYQKFPDSERRNKWVIEGCEKSKFKALKLLGEVAEDEPILKWQGSLDLSCRARQYQKYERVRMGEKNENHTIEGLWCKRICF